MLHYIEGWISVDGSLGREMHAKDCPKRTYTRSHTFSPIDIYTHKLDQPFTLTGARTHTQRQHRTRTKQHDANEMVWLHEVNEQQQPEAAGMTGRKAFLLYEKGVLTLLF